MADSSSAELETAVKRVQELRQQEQLLFTKITELQGQEQEYKLVSDTMKPMEGNRKCFQLIGTVLVEKSVQDVLPNIDRNRDGVSICRTGRAN
jgi:prefoldin subunit 2